MVEDLTHLGIGLPRRPLSQIDCVLVHRIEDGEDAAAVAKFFKDNPQYTGGGMGYHLIIRRDGKLEQAVAFDRRAPGAIKANPVAIQVALVGNLLKEPATQAQEVTLLDVLVDLSTWIGFNRVRIMGHSEFPGGSTDPKKNCPGPGIDLAKLKALSLNWATSTPADVAREELELLGYVFERK